MKILAGIRSQIKRRLLALSIVVSGLACVLSLPVQNSARGLTSATHELMYVVETKKTATFQTGVYGGITIVLLNKDGAREKAGHDRRLIVTATTLESLPSAKKVLSEDPRRQTQSGYNQNKLVLGRGQKAAQITIKQEPNEDDKDVHLLSYQSGLIHIFAEGEGIATGDTVVVVREPGRARVTLNSRSERAPGEIELLPIAWQAAATNPLRLEIMPMTPTIKTQNGEQLAYFKVALKSVTSDQFIDAPDEVKVVLEVTGGYARFEPYLLKIPKNEMITPEQAALKSRSGGSISIRASAGNADSFNIRSDNRKYDDFKPGPHTTDLSVHLQREGAVANGLDELELTVTALGDGRIMLPEDEGLEERIITFRLKGDARGVRFENGKGEVRIPKGEQHGKIKLFSTRPVGDLTAVAETWNGLYNKITTEKAATPIQFSFPWFQLLCATVGGGIFPLIRRQSKATVAQGLILGAVFFGLALFGAIASSPQNLGAVSLILAKLPTENFFASFILGLIGSVLIGFVLKRYAGASTDRLNARSNV